MKEKAMWIVDKSLKVNPYIGDANKLSDNYETFSSYEAAMVRFYQLLTEFWKKKLEEKQREAEKTYLITMEKCIDGIYSYPKILLQCKENELAIKKIDIATFNDINETCVVSKELPKEDITILKKYLQCWVEN